MKWILIESGPLRLSTFIFNTYYISGGPYCIKLECMGWNRFCSRDDCRINLCMENRNKNVS